MPTTRALYLLWQQVFWVLGGVGGIWLDGIGKVVPLPSSCRDICKNAWQNETVGPCIPVNIHHTIGIIGI